MTYAPAAEPEFAAWWLDRQQASPADLELLGTPSLGWDQLRPGWPVDSVRDARITVIGVGSIGSAAVHGLATYGVGRIALADPERLLAHNLIRHQLSARHLGLMKVDALAEQIHSSWANTVIGPLALDASADADRMRPLFDVSAAVVCAADGVRPRRVVSHLARRSGTPAVLACILEEGEIGEIIRLMPWPTKGCLLCHRQHLADSGRFDPEPTLDLPYGQGTGPRPMTAVAGDLQLVGQLAAKVAVATLLEGNGYYDQVLSADHLVVGLRPRPGLPPPADVRRAAELRWSVIGSPRPGCPSCHPATADEATSGLSGDRQMNSTGPGPHKSPAALPSDRTKCPLIVTVTGTCRAAISLNPAAAADGRETGGILLVHHHNYSQPVLDVVHACDAGPRAVRQATTFFRRDVTHAQALAEVAYGTDGSVWLGEWHTHPGRLSKPSFLDLASYRQMLDDPELAFTFFLAVIVLSGQADGWHRPCLTGGVVSTANVWSVRLQPRTHPQGAS